METIGMDTKQNKATINRPEGDRVLDAPVVFFDLEEVIHQIKNEPAWQDRDRNSITIFKSGSVTTVLVAMHPKAEMKTMEPENLMMVQVMEGRLVLNANNQTTTISKNQYLALHEHIPYTLQAEDESVFLLTVIEDGTPKQ
jgi:quercetin dioxygenase-like cupin family protein